MLFTQFMYTALSQCSAPNIITIFSVFGLKKWSGDVRGYAYTRVFIRKIWLELY